MLDIRIKINVYAKSQKYVMAAGSQSAPLCVNIILMDSKLVGMGALIGDITVYVYIVCILWYTIE